MLDDKQHVTALVRDKEKLSDITSENLTIVEADLTDNFEKAFKHCDNVVFVAGSGGNTGADKTLLIDLWAACRAADYAKDPSEGPEEMQPYLVAKHMADEHLKRTGLHFSIIRPGTLTNEEATGKFTTERAGLSSNEATITRADVAHALQFCLNNPPKVSAVTELFNGNKSIGEALQ